MPTNCNDLEDFKRTVKAVKEFKLNDDQMLKSDVNHVRDCGFNHDEKLPHLFVTNAADAKVIKEDKDQLDRIEEKIDKILTKLDNIFGNHLMVDGKFIKL